MSESRLTRRASLAKLGGVVAAAAAGGVAADQASGGPAGVARGVVSCVLSPEMTEGPFFFPGDPVRSDVRGGKPGTVLDLRLTVVDASTCKPIRGARVDIWHCDAAGVYSGAEQLGTEGESFLRGIQRTNASGLAVFRTIYPGWYPGRAVHIHLRAYLGGNVIHTGQVFFPDKLTDEVYKRAPYAARPNRDPRNAGDSIFRNGGSRSMLKLRRKGAGYIGSITLGVSRS